MKEITDMTKISFSKQYNIEVVNCNKFEGAFEELNKTYEKCTVESANDDHDNMDFSFGLEDDEIENYEDIPEENMIVVNQDDIDDGNVKIYEL